MKPATHCSFFDGFFVSWHQPMTMARKAAVEAFEQALDAKAVASGKKSWGQARDEAFAAMPSRQRKLMGKPLLIHWGEGNR